MLGDDNFVKWVYNKFVSSRKENKEIPELKKIRPQVSVDKVGKLICMEFDSRKEDVLQKGRKRNFVRDIAMYICRDICGEPIKNI